MLVCHWVEWGNISMLNSKLAVPSEDLNSTLSHQGRHSDWQCPMQRLSGARGTTPGCPQLGEAGNHQSVCHRR